jgi:hypothetical protein
MLFQIILRVVLKCKGNVERILCVFHRVVWRLKTFVSTLEHVGKNIPIRMEARVKIFKHYRTLEIALWWVLFL